MLQAISEIEMAEERFGRQYEIFENDVIFRKFYNRKNETCIFAKRKVHFSRFFSGGQRLFKRCLSFAKNLALEFVAAQGLYSCDNDLKCRLSVFSVECRVTLNLRNSSRPSDHQTFQAALKSSHHRGNYLALIKFPWTQRVINLYYFLFADVSCVESAVSPKPCCCRYWFMSFVCPLNRGRASSIRQR